MIKLNQSIVDRIYAHGNHEAPFEACGYLAGRDNEITEIYSMTNIDHSPEHYSLDPREQFAVIKTARNAGLKLLAVYHTHPASPARPSEEDIKLAYDPNIIYVIASLLEPLTIKAFHIIEGVVQPLEIEIL